MSQTAVPRTVQDSLQLILKRGRMSATAAADWQEQAARALDSLDSALRRSHDGEVGSRDHEGNRLFVYCYGPSADALLVAARVALTDLPLAPGSEARLRRGDAEEDEPLPLRA